MVDRILSLNIQSDSEEDYGSANNSLRQEVEFDGAVVTPVNPTDPPTANNVTELLQEVRVRTNKMVNYDSKCEDDSDGALEKACHNLKGYEFTENDLKFYFGQVELRMRQCGVKKITQSF